MNLQPLIQKVLVSFLFWIKCTAILLFLIYTKSMFSLDDCTWTNKHRVLGTQDAHGCRFHGNMWSQNVRYRHHSTEIGQIPQFIFCRRLTKNLWHFLVMLTNLTFEESLITQNQYILVINEFLSCCFHRLNVGMYCTYQHFIKLLGPLLPIDRQTHPHTRLLRLMQPLWLMSLM